MLADSHEPPSLPAELHALIIQLAAEDYHSNFDTPIDSNSAKSLAALSLVSRSFRRLAQAQLFRELTLQSKLDVELWLSVIGNEDGWDRSVARHVRIARVGQLEPSTSLERLLGPLHPRSDEDYCLGRVLQSCGGLEVLKLASLIDLDLDVLRYARGLHSLYIWACDDVIASSATSWSITLPHLRRLYITDLTSSPEVMGPFLHPSTLPSLQTLTFALCAVGQEDSASEAWFNMHAIPLVKQLRCLSTSDMIVKEFSGFDHLVMLDCWHVAITRTTILYLPFSLRFLRLNPTYFGQTVDVFTKAWEQHESTVLQNLDEISVPHAYEANPLYDGLRQMCKKRSVRLNYEQKRAWEEEGGHDQMTEDAALDQPFWRLARRVESLLADEERRGL